MKTIHAKIANGGFACGKAFVLSKRAKTEKTLTSDPDGALRELDGAIETVRADYERLLSEAAAAGNTVAEGILQAQLAILQDPVLYEKITALVRNSNFCGAYAAECAGEEMASVLEASDSDYLRARSSDVRLIAGKLSDALSGNTAATVPEEPSVIVAEEAAPEQLIRIGREKILALITENGSPLSHVSILAGTYGIPYLFGTEELPENGTEIAVDGEQGLVILNPDGQTKKDVGNKIREYQEQSSAEPGDESYPIRLYANIASPKDLDDVINNGAEGIGLFRTEFLYMNRKELPTEEEQFQVYRAVLEGMHGKEVIIRTMDIGADKKTECLPLPAEENPALGRRAIRICLDEPELFRTQLRAILRAACYGNAGIMYPMITSCEELEAISEQVRLSAQELEQRQERYTMPKQGIMIETPAAAVISDLLAEHVDFFSIGTNDLTQYTLALDRQGEGLDRYYNPHHEAIYRLIQMTAENAHRHNTLVSICGELGGNPKAIRRLAECGVDELSMSPGKLPQARAVLRKMQEESRAAFEELTAPADGMLIPMEQIPDEAFASGVLGTCIAVETESGEIFAPCSGTVTMVSETKHAFGIRSDAGSEILIHIGINTVSLKGQGFDCKLQKGQRIQQGELLMHADVGYIRSKGLSPMVIMVYGLK